MAHLAEARSGPRARGFRLRYDPMRLTHKPYDWLEVPAPRRVVRDVHREADQ
jgi:hypothetical protein